MRLSVVLVVAIVVVTSALNPFKQLVVSKALEFRSFAQQTLAKHEMSYAPSNEYPYWNFIPQYVTTLNLGQKLTSWSSSCFKSNKASIVRSGDGSQLNIKITSSEPLSTSHVCEDIYMAITASALELSFTIRYIDKLPIPVIVTNVNLTLPKDITLAEEWDLNSKGVRILKYQTRTAEALSNVLKTLDLFIPELTLGVPESVAKNNIDFMAKYTHFDISARDPSESAPPAASEVHSGDSFYIMRLDGLNPMLAWAMGSTTGHVTTAMWIDGELFVCESTIADAYWPTDFVQKTPYDSWLQQAVAADFQVIWVPLGEEARKNYNETAAVEFFRSVEGLDYGFKTILWGWLDTVKGNFPCLPPDFSSVCLQWELLEPLIAYVDRLVPQIGEMVWNAGLAKRLNIADNLRTADYYMEADKQGMKSVEVLVIPERDDWLYNTTRNDQPAVGRAMVCCVFVCSMWKAAGVFGNLAGDINCAEQTNWDDYALTIHADSYQQIIGSYTLKLNDFRSRTPYAHMGETCTTLAPDYAKTATC